MSTLPRTPSFRLDGQRALVAGATSGIGLGCAVAIAEAGASVTLVARSADKLEQTVRKFRDEGWKAEAMVMDISDVAACESMLAARAPFDILVNSAGSTRPSPATDTTEADYDLVMAANLKGAFFLTRTVAKALIAVGKSGSLINISSQMGHVGGVDRALYCASKHGVEGLTKSMAVEFGPHNIRVNTICPTFIRTPLAEITLKNPDRRRWIEEKIKLGRIGEIEDIMGAVVFLASDASALVTGSALMVDGGWTAD